MVSEEAYNFQKLTPVNDIDLSIYKNALDFIFENPDVKNIGVSGAYSAGKSSVVETYKKLRPDIRFLHISLAYFHPASENDIEPTVQDEIVLEGKILNQLIHQITPSKIPQTNFRVKRQFPSRKLWLSTAMVSLAIFFMLYLLNWTNWLSFVSSLTSVWLKNILLPTTDPTVVILAGLTCVGILSYIVYEIFKIQFNKNLFKGISVQGNTIEIFEQSEESYFDKYLNEVLYLFENSDKDVIVFEDMDRYNTNQIFQRLREINTLINSRKKDAEKPIRFFYLLRDDIFINKERTKFFDFIIPIVPILDGSNSFDQFIMHFKKGNIYHLFNEHFLQDVSLYIDDVRILKNIYNEFLIYYKRISTTEQDPNKLLAMIIYKNIFPRDFSELQLNSGFVHTLFDKKAQFINDEITQLKSEIEKLNHKIETAEKEHLQSIKEVESLYNPEIQDLNRYYGINERVQALIKERDSRKENIKNKTEESKNELRNKISLIEVSIVEIQNKKLHEIITKLNVEKIFKVSYTNEIGTKIDFNDIKGSDYFPLIKYLIRHGYIDETYPDYMTYFYEHSLSRVDKIFLRSVTDEESKDYSYQLKDPVMVLTHLSEVSFNNEETLNFDLLSYLLDNQNAANKNKLEKMLQQLKKNKNFKFIDLYFKSGKSLDVFIRALNNIWPDAFSAILSESNFTEELKKEYALESIYHTDDEVLVAANSEDIFSTFISTHKDFLKIENPNIKRLVDVFELLNVKFEGIDYTVSNKELFQAVYQHSLYIISFELVCLMLKEIYNCRTKEDLKHKNYTVVLSKPDEPLVNYLEENINDYVTEVLSHCDGKIFDSEEIALRLLNNSDLDKSLKENYINKLTTPIHYFTDINEVTLWRELLGCDLVVYSEVNVLHYFFHSGNGFDILITDLINKKGTSVNFDYAAIDNEFEKGSGSKFFNAVVKNEYLNIEPYAKILKSLNRVYNTFSIGGISDPKMDVLIVQGIISMTEESLLFMREYYVNKVIRFVIRNIRKYTEEVISEEIFVIDEMLEILISNVADEYKLSLLKFTDQPLSALVDNYSDKLKIYILKNNFDSNDIPELLKEYPALTSQIQSVVEDIVESNIETIIGKEYYLSFQLCQKLFTRGSMSTESKLQLFAVAVCNFSVSECKECLAILNRKDILSTFSGKRPAIPITENNEKILDAMVKKHWIIGYDVDKKDEKMYRVSSKRVSKQQSLPAELL